MIDSSSSIGESTFRDKMCKYVADAVEKFTGDIRAGVVVYSSRVGTTISIQNNSDGLVQSIRGLSYIGATTNTADAIEAAKDLLLDRHPARIKVMAVLTDGESNNKPATSLKAKAARDAGISIFAIGIGVGANQTEIHAIASSPATRYAHNIDGFVSRKFDEDIQKLLDGKFNH